MFSTTQKKKKDRIEILLFQAQWVKVPAAKPNMSPILGTHEEEGEN